MHSLDADILTCRGSSAPARQEGKRGQPLSMHERRDHM